MTKIFLEKKKQPQEYSAAVSLLKY